MSKPHLFNLAAEAAVLGAVLFENGEYESLSTIVRAEHFCAPANQLLWRRMGALIETGQTADGVTLELFAKETPEIRDVGGEQYLFDLLDSAPLGDEAKHYARMIADYAARRLCVQTARHIETQASSSETPVVEVIHETRAALDDIENMASLANVTESAADSAEDTFAVGAAAALLPTYFESLDRELAGFERGAVSLIGARPGVGKTATALAIAANVAGRNESVGFFSLDMTARVSRQRLAFYIAYLERFDTPFFSEMRRPDSPWITPQFREKMIAFLKGPIGQKVLFNGQGNITTAALNSQVRAWKRECAKRSLPPLGMVIIDHIGKVTPIQNARSLYEKTSYASNEILEVAKQHEGVAFVALSQLNRASSVEQRRPTMSDIRDSGKLEEDASAIILVHREDYYLAQVAKNEGVNEHQREKAQKELAGVRGMIEFIIGKNRNGEVGAVTLRHTIGKNIIRDATREEPTQEKML